MSKIEYNNSKIYFHTIFGAYVTCCSLTFAMVYSSYLKQRVLYFHIQGYKAPTIKKICKEEGLVTSRVGIYRFIVHSEEYGIMRKPGTGRPSKICREIKSFVEQMMQANDETMAHQLHALLMRAGYSISISTILRCRTSLGWTFRGSSYCQS